MTTENRTALSDLPQEWRLATLAMHHAPRVLLAGLPGTGKSLLATGTREHPSGGTVAPEDIYNLTLHEDSSAFDIIGGYLPKAGKWDWRHGPGALAWITSHERTVRIVLNELDQAGPAVLTALYAILDDPKSARLTLPTGETITPNSANLQIVATMNGTPDDLPPALADRLTAHVTLDSPHPDSIAALPEHWRETAEGMSSASARRERRGTTPRDWHALADLTTRGVSMADAAALVWPGERAGEVLDHLAVHAAPAVEETLSGEEDDPDTYESDPYEEHRAAVASGDRFEYRCANDDCGGFNQEEPDSDDDVCCPECGEYSAAAIARDLSLEHYAA